MKKFILTLSAIALLLIIGIATPGCERKESQPTAPEATAPRDSGTNGAVEKEALPGMEKEQLEETQKPEAAEPQAEEKAKEEKEQRNGATPSQKPSQQSPEY